jgi:hypothetical protein
MNKIEDLKFIRIFDPTLVPKTLIEQIKNRQHTVQDFYDYNNDKCFIFDGESARINPLNHLYVLVDENNKIKGVLWCTLDGQQCTVELFSIEKEYWNKGNALKFVSDTMGNIAKELGIKNIRLFTTNPGSYEKIGFKRSKHIMMEQNI